MKQQINTKQLLLQIAIPLLTGALSGFLTSNNISIYSTLNTPSFSPPGFLFPIVWTIIYLLMGIASYLIIASDSPNKTYALSIYGIGLFLNFLWSIVFFNLQNYTGAFIILMILWFLILLMIINYWQINAVAGILLLPYLIWVTFAGILNLYIVLFN